MGQIIGGVLMVNGIKGFLDNYANRRVADDPVRNGIAVLAGHVFDSAMVNQRQQQIIEFQNAQIEALLKKLGKKRLLLDGSTAVRWL